MKKKIFITGITSIIIEKLCKNIDFSKYEVIGLSRNSEKNFNKNIKIVKGDIKNINTFSNYLEKCDIIIHAAAITHSYNSKNYYKINFDATKQIVDTIKKNPSKKIIFISSNTADKKSGAYGHSKLLAENYIVNNCNNWQIIRLSEVFGAFQEGIDKLIDNAINKSLILCPTGIPYKFSPIHIDDVSIQLLNHIFNKPFKNELINITGNEKFSFKEIITLIKKYKKIHVIYVNKKIMSLILKISKIIPFNIGIIPDQIERLYGIKSYTKNNVKIHLSLSDYIIKLINKK